MLITRSLVEWLINDYQIDHWSKQILGAVDLFLNFSRWGGQVDGLRHTVQRKRVRTCFWTKVSRSRAISIVSLREPEETHDRFSLLHDFGLKYQTLLFRIWSEKSMSSCWYNNKYMSCSTGQKLRNICCWDEPGNNPFLYSTLKLGRKKKFQIFPHVGCVEINIFLLTRFIHTYWRGDKQVKQFFVFCSFPVVIFCNVLSATS